MDYDDVSMTDAPCSSGTVDPPVRRRPGRPPKIPTSDVAKRAEIRREQNRQAAERARRKRLSEVEQLRQRVTMLEAEIVARNQEITFLRTELRRATNCNPNFAPTNPQPQFYQRPTSSQSSSMHSSGPSTPLPLLHYHQSSRNYSGSNPLMNNSPDLVGMQCMTQKTTWDITYEAGVEWATESRCTSSSTSSTSNSHTDCSGFSDEDFFEGL